MILKIFQGRILNNILMKDMQVHNIICSLPMSAYMEWNFYVLLNIKNPFVSFNYHQNFLSSPPLHLLLKAVW